MRIQYKTKSAIQGLGILVTFGSNENEIVKKITEELLPLKCTVMASVYPNRDVQQTWYNRRGKGDFGIKNQDEINIFIDETFPILSKYAAPDELLKKQYGIND